MERMFGLLMVLGLMMTTIFIDYSFAEKPMSYSRFKMTVNQMPEGTPITIHAETSQVDPGQLLSDHKLSAVHFASLDKEGNAAHHKRFNAYFLVSSREFLIRNTTEVGAPEFRRFNPYDPTMLDRVLDFMDNNTKVEIRGRVVKTKIGRELIIETIEPLESAPKTETTDSYVLTIKTSQGSFKVGDIKLGEEFNVDRSKWIFKLEKE